MLLIRAHKGYLCFDTLHRDFTAGFSKDQKFFFPGLSHPVQNPSGAQLCGDQPPRLLRGHHSPEQVTGAAGHLRGAQLSQR